MQEAQERRLDGNEPEPKAINLEAVWGELLAAVHCARCGEAHLVPEQALGKAGEGALTLRCPFCLQGPVTPQPAHLGEEPPEQMLPYSVSEQKLAAALERWAQGIRFRPTDLDADVLTRRAERYFIPLWLVDGQVKGTWRADVGFDYEVVSYQDRYSDGGGWDSWALKEGRIRWEPRVGRIDRSYDNLATPALDDHHDLMERLSEFDLRQRADYAPEAIAGAAVRIPTLEPQAAWPGAKAAFDRAAGAECRQAAAADHIRNFTLDAEYEGLNWTLLLLPAYVTWYREGERIWPLLINGQNGQVSGVRRASMRKATTVSLALGGIALLLFVVGGIVALASAFLPLLFILGALLLLVGVLLAVAAPIPAISAWAFNRNTRE